MAKGRSTPQRWPCCFGSETVTRRQSGRNSGPESWEHDAQRCRQKTRQSPVPRHLRVELRSLRPDARTDQDAADVSQYRRDASHRIAGACGGGGNALALCCQGPGSDHDRHHPGDLGSRTLGGPDAQGLAACPGPTAPQAARRCACPVAGPDCPEGQARVAAEAHPGIGRLGDEYPQHPRSPGARRRAGRVRALRTVGTSAKPNSCGRCVPAAEPIRMSGRPRPWLWPTGKRGR